MRILFTAFTYRCLENWLPLVYEIRKNGGICDYIFFPRISDPNHRKLLEIKENILLVDKIDSNFNFVNRTKEEVLLDFTKNAVNYDAVLMTSCVAGPELDLKKAMNNSYKSPIFIGLQHGFYQNWEGYENNFDCFDYFGVFGEAFINKFNEKFRNRVISLGLPKLDNSTAQHRTAKHYNTTAREIEIKIKTGQLSFLFALQSTVPTKIVRDIVKCLQQKSYNVILRPHPEHIDIYSPLLDNSVKLSDKNKTFIEALSEADIVLTSGSTAALESIEAYKPTIIIPEQNGNVYRDFDIVADSCDIKDIMDVLRKYQSPHFNNKLRKTMTSYTGVSGLRSEIAYRNLTKLIKKRPSPLSKLWNLIGLSSKKNNTID